MKARESAGKRGKARESATEMLRIPNQSDNDWFLPHLVDLHEIALTAWLFLCRENVYAPT